MGVRNRQDKKVRYFKLKQKTDENNAPFFIENVKEGNSYKDGDVTSELFGTITNIDLKTANINGSDINYFTLYIDDGEEIEVINLMHGSVSRDILNKIADPEKDLSKPISIQVYRNKSEGNDGKIYYNGLAAVRYDETKELFSWAVHPKDFPKIDVMTMKNGKKVIDSTDLDAFFENDILNKIKNKLKKSSTSTSNTKTENNETQHYNQDVNTNISTSIENEDEYDDLPF